MPVPLAKRLREIRMARNRSQAWLANKVGVHVQTIKKWEKGTTTPNPIHQRVIAKHLRIKPHHLHQEVDDPFPGKVTPRLTTVTQRFHFEDARLEDYAAFLAKLPVASSNIVRVPRNHDNHNHR